MSFEEFLREWRNDNDFISAFTSGSTGRPKKIRLSKKFVEESAIRTIDFFNIKEGALLHSCVSPEFIGGKMMAVRAEIAKADLTWEEPSNMPLRNFDSNRIIDLLAVVPSQMQYILENKETLPQIRNIIIGGSAIHPELRKKIMQSGLNAFETYGMTETASHIALRKVTDPVLPFQTLPGISISVDHDSCLKISFGEDFEVQTNDIAELVSDNQFYIKGRRDNIIISGGKKINPLEIEERISLLIPYPFIITGFPDEKWVEKSVLIIEAKDFDTINLKQHLKNILSNWEIPKEIILMENLPRTSNGKIIRNNITLPKV